MFRFTGKNMPLRYCVQYHLLKVRPCHSELLPRRSVVGEDPRRKSSYILNSPLIVGDIDAQFITFICQIDVAAWYWQKRWSGLTSNDPHSCWLIPLLCWQKIVKATYLLGYVHSHYVLAKPHVIFDPNGCCV